LDREIGGEGDELNLENQRRTIYGLISRRRLDGMLSLFDFPDPNLSSERRASTNVPLQGLFFLNSPLIAQEAAALAKRLTADGEQDESRIRKAYLLLYGRPATGEEISVGIEFLGKAAAGPGGGSAPWQQYAQALLSASEFYFLD
jgi:hypothetical protein